MAPTAKKGGPGCLGRSRGGLTTKIHKIHALANRAYDSDAPRTEMAARGPWANIKPIPNRL
jgi:hypothetical protein